MRSVLARGLLGLSVLATVAPAIAQPQRQETARPRPRYEAEALASGAPIELDAYAEYRQGGVFIIDGQRVRVIAATTVGGEVRNASEIELGFEAKVQGRRLDTGVIVVEHIEVSPNGSQLLETQVRSAGHELEREWLQAGRMYDGERTIGEIVSYDDRVLCVEKILANLKPSYLVPGEVRVHVVETRLWNASAMANGSIWIYTGLMEAISDDELAVILGHELAHYTHEHSRRSAKSGMWKQALANLGAGLIGGALAGGAGSSVANVAALIGTQAWTNGYSRELEDQADRVGLRYAHEADYDVWAGPGLWDRFRERFGEADPVTNFILGTHSRPTDRILNIQRELQINYRDVR